MAVERLVDRGELAEGLNLAGAPERVRLPNFFKPLQAVATNGTVELETF